jgi:hypothetical protein
MKGNQLQGENDGDIVTVVDGEDIITIEPSDKK